MIGAATMHERIHNQADEMDVARVEDADFDVMDTHLCRTFIRKRDMPCD
jgi:hypothetical protein